MKTNCLVLPFGEIKVYRNDKQIEFEYEEINSQTYLYNDAEVQPLGFYNLLINPKAFAVGNIIKIVCTAGKLENDGGDEGTVNLVGILDEYIYGIGGIDTHFLEWNFDNLIDIASYDYIKHELSYSLLVLDDSSISYTIEDGENKYNYGKGLITTPIVYELKSKPYAYDMVSILTC